MHAFLIEIPENDIKKEFGAFYNVARNWGEKVCWAYLLRHPDFIEANLECLGVGELWHPPIEGTRGSCLDLLFHKGDVYYPVEVKHRDPKFILSTSWLQLFREVECFKQAMHEKGVQFSEIIPVLVVYGEVEHSKKKHNWPEWYLGPL